MRVLGVDPGLTRCGVGVVDGAPGGRCQLVYVDVVRTPADADIGSRLLALDEAFVAAIAAYRPDVVAVERVFSQQNVRTVMGTAQAGAVALTAAARAGVPVALRTPSEVKAAVTGNGRADKNQVTTMVTRLLQLTERPKPADAADALALAICQLWRGGPQHKMSAMAQKVRSAQASSSVQLATKRQQDAVREAQTKQAKARQAEAHANARADARTKARRVATEQAARRSKGA